MLSKNGAKISANMQHYVNLQKCHYNCVYSSRTFRIFSTTIVELGFGPCNTGPVCRLEQKCSLAYCHLAGLRLVSRGAGRFRDRPMSLN